MKGKARIRIQDRCLLSSQGSFHLSLAFLKLGLHKICNRQVRMKDVWVSRVKEDYFKIPENWKYANVC